MRLPPRAFSDLDAIAACIKERGSHENARRWFNGIIGAIAALSNLPSRCPVAEESEELGQQVHLLVHGRRNRGYKVESVPIVVEGLGRRCKQASYYAALDPVALAGLRMASSIHRSL